MDAQVGKPLPRVAGCEYFVFVFEYLREAFAEAMQTEEAIAQVDALGQNYFFADGEEFAKMNEELYAMIEADPAVFLGS